MKRLVTLVSGVMFMIGLSGIAVAGILDSPGAPSGGSGLYTLSQIYDYLNSGIKTTPVPVFQEPSMAPGSTMKTTKEIYDDIMAKFDECNVTTAAEVKSGYKFFCTQPGSWGVRTGTLIVPSTPTPTPTSTSTPTSTPTSTATPWCALAGGYWAPLNDGTGDYGCWFHADFNQSCSSACSAISTSLSCDTRNWNDDTNCSISRNYYPSLAGCHVVTDGGGICEGAGGATGAPNSYSNAGAEPAYGWGYRDPLLSQSCNAQHHCFRRICVCRP